MPLFTFTNGNARQQMLWEEGAAHLLNFPIDKIPADIEVTFVDPGLLTKQTTLAETTADYDDAAIVMEVRDDFPEWNGYPDGKLTSLKAEAFARGLPWSVERFAVESSAHELGHGLFAILPESIRVAVAQLFGAESDDPDEIYDEDLEWQDRIGEGIAETFKEAFLPQQFRVFPNRSRRTIPYVEYPHFRSLFRGLAASGFSYVYGSDSFRVDLFTPYGLDEFPYHESDRDPEAFVFYNGCEGVDMSQFEESGTLPFSIEPAEDVIG